MTTLPRCLVTLALVSNAGLAMAAPPTAEELAHHDGPVAGCVIHDHTPRAAPVDAIAAPVVELDAYTGEPIAFDTRAENLANRLQLVLVGDGYTSAEMGTYATHAGNAATNFFSVEPFTTYRNLFNVYRVDVVSNVSGVSGDPTADISRVTPLQMRYWCSGTERLLCVNVSRCYQYAANAPYGYDQILAIANSSKYGGAGYPGNDVGTLAGANSAAAQIAIHEMGHSLGDLADEYDYGGPTTYVGGEPSDANATIYTAATLQSQQRKWWRWIGFNQAAWDGNVSTFQGAMYSVQGIYRPTNNSMMRALYRPFNLPSAEQLIINIYKQARPIDDATPTATVLTPASQVFVTPVRPTQPLEITWYKDGVALAGVNGETLNVGDLDLRRGASQISVRVRDMTPWVRDEAARTTWMTQTRAWTVNAPACRADMNNDRVVDDADFALFAVDYDSFTCTRCSGDLNDDGFVDDTDFVLFAAAYDRYECD